MQQNPSCCRKTPFVVTVMMLVCSELWANRAASAAAQSREVKQVRFLTPLECGEGIHNLAWLLTYHGRQLGFPAAA